MSLNRLKTEFAIDQADDQLSLAGRLIVAAPNWKDQTFSRTVCLLVQHDHEGAIGVVLNRDFEFDAPGLWQQLAGSQQSELRQDVLQLGGPHSGPILALHDCDEFAEFQSAKGVYLAAQVGTLRALVRESGDKRRALKILVGQANWTAGQLDQELAAGKWLPLPTTPDVVFSEPNMMWPFAMRQAGNHFVTAITRAIPTQHVLNN